MGTALFTAVTGLRTHQRRIDVIANNIANVNTTAFRGSRMLFQDLFSQTLQGARPSSGGFGGTNPQQIGLGTSIASIDVNQTQGALLTTGGVSDLAIQGNGFFIMTDGATTTYTRDGSFQINADGVLIDPASGLRVQGYMADSAGTINTEANVSDLTIPVGGASIVQATDTVNILGNLNSDAAVGDTVIRTVRVYDSLGTPRDIEVTYTKAAQVTVAGTPYNAWNWAATYTDAGGTTTTVNSGVAPATLLFNSDGSLFDEGTVVAGVFTARAAGAPEISVSAAALGALASFPDTPFEFNLNFARVTELAATSDVTVSSQDGFPRGTLESFNISRDGVINGVFTNGLTRVLGQVAVAGFTNTAGMVRIGGNLFRDSPVSGLPQIGLPSTGGRGSVSSGALEGSNVDLGEEFSSMIITQRGFQANARTITTADQILQETVNLVR